MLLMGYFTYDKKVARNTIDQQNNVLYFDLYQKMTYSYSKKIHEILFDIFVQNQRTLPFNVDILDLPSEKRVHMGSSSESKNTYYNLIILYSMSSQDRVIEYEWQIFITIRIIIAVLILSGGSVRSVVFIQMYNWSDTYTTHGIIKWRWNRRES